MNAVFLSLDQLGLFQIFLGTSALTCLCLASKRNARQVGRHFKRPALLSAGWMMIAIVVAIALASANPNQAIVATLGALSLSTLLIVGLLTYRPEWLVNVGLYSAFLACASLALGLLL